MRGVIAPCHTHLKLSLPWRQWQRWITAWQCNSRVSTSLHFHWAISTQLCHYQDRQRERTSNWAPGLEKNGESGPERCEEDRRVDRDLRGGGRGGGGGGGGGNQEEEAEESGVWGCTELAGGAAERATAAARAHLHTHTHIHFPGKDSELCRQWRMKKHSARVAPLSSYSTQVLTCPISEGKLRESERPNLY